MFSADQSCVATGLMKYDSLPCFILSVCLPSFYGAWYLCMRNILCFANGL